MTDERVPVDYLVEGAADWELGPLIEAIDGPLEEQQSIWTFWRGHIGSSQVVVARTDWGPINAVAATVTAIGAYQPRAIICQGMAGAHDPDLNVGDIVVGAQTVDVSAYKSGPTPLGAGYAISNNEPLAHRFRLNPQGKLASFSGFQGDEKLMATALAGKNHRGRIVAGTIGSAYQYNRQLDLIQELRRLYSTKCEDMESAFAAGAALALGVPFIAIRMISNSEWNHPELDKSTGTACATFVRDLIRG